jgi:4-hydroxy-3-methylbut-2-enyl diphosphate reductase
MKINISSYAGFCFGVDRALMMMDKVIRTSKKPIQMLGNLVHNEQVVEKLKKQGVKVINSLKEAREGTLVITAHGIDQKIIKKAKAKNLYVIDTSCPFVLKAHQLAKILRQENRKVIIFGDKNHIEVGGIAGACGGGAILIESFYEAKKYSWSKFKRIGIVSQTTQNTEDFEKFIKYVQSKVGDVKVFDTICNSTRGRQEDVRKMALENEVILVIGSKTSANTVRLYETAKKINPKTYFVRNKDDLKKEWFDSTESVGISGGASTPREVIREVAKSVKQENKKT